MPFHPITICFPLTLYQATLLTSSRNVIPFKTFWEAIAETGISTNDRIKRNILDLLENFIAELQKEGLR